MSYPENVFIALILTAGMVASLTAYAIYTESDFTICGGMLFMLTFILIIAIFLSIFIQSKVFDIVISAAVIFLYGIYFIYDTQLIIGGKTNELTIDDYILGALLLYIDIIQIFIEILKILERVN